MLKVVIRKDDWILMKATNDSRLLIMNWRWQYHNISPDITAAKFITLHCGKPVQCQRYSGESFTEDSAEGRLATLIAEQRVQRRTMHMATEWFLSHRYFGYIKHPKLYLYRQFHSTASAAAPVTKTTALYKRSMFNRDTEDLRVKQIYRYTIIGSQYQGINYCTNLFTWLS